MKIYRLEKGIVLVGKAWEIRTKLKEYNNMYKTVDEWLQDDKTMKKLNPRLKKSSKSSVW